MASLLLAGCSLYVDAILGPDSSPSATPPKGPIPCTSGARRCLGDFVQECQSDGRYESIRICPPGQCNGDTLACSTDVVDGGLGDAAEGRTDGGSVDAAEIGADAGTADASDGGNVAPASMASCAESGPGRSDCGDGGESCCVSLAIPAGTFDRSDDPAAPATLSAYRLDKYEVTVGRFRRFVDAWVGGWRPTSGAGKHSHLNGGQGLVNTAGGYEPGWDPSWANSLPTSKSGTGGWDSWLSCLFYFTSWTSGAGSNEKRPINCVDWNAAYAFCIWDGGFLPSESEWNYAASGGSEQRLFPWGSGGGYGYASYDCMGDGVSGCIISDLLPVGSKPMGNGRWGHSDLGGNVWEWTLDWNQTYSSSCRDCVNASGGSQRVTRGGSSISGPADMHASNRYSYDPSARDLDVGFRCSRTP